MFLLIDTSDINEIILALVDEKGNFLANKKIRAKYKQSEKLLVGIEELRSRVTKGRMGFELKGIIVVKGPGSFTSLRIGVATANALAFGIKVPVVGVKKKKEMEKLSRRKLTQTGKQRNKETGEIGKLRNSGIRYNNNVGYEELYLVRKGLKVLEKAKLNKWVVPEYGREPHITIKK